MTYVTLSESNVSGRGVGKGGGGWESPMRESRQLSPTNVASHAGVQFRGAQWGLSSNPAGDVICGLSLLIDLG